MPLRPPIPECFSTDLLTLICCHCTKQAATDPSVRELPPTAFCTNIQVPGLGFVTGSGEMPHFSFPDPESVECITDKIRTFCAAIKQNCLLAEQYEFQSCQIRIGKE